MKTWWICLVAFTLVVCCGGEDDGSPNPDTEPGPDSDVDSDSDADECTGEIPENGEGVDLVFDENGWVDNETNELGIQGAWYSFADGDNPPDVEDVAFSTVELYTDGEKQCAEGMVARVPDDMDDDGQPEWNLVWGIGIGFNLCFTGECESDTPETQMTVGECPLNENLANEFEGITFSWESKLGDLGNDPMRVTFAEGEEASAYIEELPGEDKEALIEEAAIYWDGEQPPSNICPVHSIQFMLPADNVSEYEFDICIWGIKAIKGEVDVDCGGSDGDADGDADGDGDGDSDGDA